MTVEKLGYWLPVTDETFIDAGMGTPEQRAEANARIKARWAATHAAWMALPWWERARRRIVYNRRRYEWPHRVAVAWDVLRGRHECEP